MQLLDTPDSNIFWYAITKNTSESSVNSIGYFEHVKSGNSMLLDSVKEEIDNFIYKKCPYIRSFLILCQISGDDIEAELSNISKKRNPEEKEKIVLESSNIVRYLHEKVGNNFEFSINIQHILRKEMDDLFALFEKRSIPSLKKWDEKIQDEVEALNNLGLENHMDALHMVNFFDYLQNQSINGIFITYDKNDFSFCEKLKEKLWRIKIQNPKEFLASRNNKTE